MKSYEKIKKIRFESEYLHLILFNKIRFARNALDLPKDAQLKAHTQETKYAGCSVFTDVCTMDDVLELADRSSLERISPGKDNSVYLTFRFPEDVGTVSSTKPLPGATYKMEYVNGRLLPVGDLEESTAGTCFFTVHLKREIWAGDECSSSMCGYAFADAFPGWPEKEGDLTRLKKGDVISAEEVLARGLQPVRLDSLKHLFVHVLGANSFRKSEEAELSPEARDLLREADEYSYEMEAYANSGEDEDEDGDDAAPDLDECLQGMQKGLEVLKRGAEIMGKLAEAINEEEKQKKEEAERRKELYRFDVAPESNDRIPEKVAHTVEIAGQVLPWTDPLAGHTMSTRQWESSWFFNLNGVRDLLSLMERVVLTNLIPGRGRTIHLVFDTRKEEIGECAWPIPETDGQYTIRRQEDSLVAVGPVEFRKFNVTFFTLVLTPVKLEDGTEDYALTDAFPGCIPYIWWDSLLKEGDVISGPEVVSREFRPIEESEWKAAGGKSRRGKTEEGERS